MGRGGGGSGKNGQHVEGSRRGALAPTGGDSPGGAAQPAAARHSQQRPGRGACVRTAAGGAGSLMGGAQVAAGGRGAHVGPP
jgi:hypothetical protein